MALVVVERDFSEPVLPERLERLALDTGAGAALRTTYLAVGGRRALSVLEVPEDGTAASTLTAAPYVAWSAWTYRMPDANPRAGHGLVAVERSFRDPVHPPDLAAKERAVQWCHEHYAVQFLFNYVASDGLKMVCFYGAPDAESVRQTQKTGKMPHDRVWSARAIEHA